MWIILKCDRPVTLSLFDALRRDGFDVWAPVEVSVKTEYRSKRKIERRVPIMAGYVFADERHSYELAPLTEKWDSPYPRFKIWTRYNNAGARECATIDEAELENLRWEEDRAARRLDEARRRERKVEKLPIGAKVEGTGAWRGVYGVITRDLGRWAEVSFGPHSTPVKIQWIDFPEERKIAA